MENTLSYSSSVANPYAGIMARIKAYLIDSVIILTVSLTISILINLALWGFDISQLRLGAVVFMSMMILPFLNLIYCILYEISSKRGTIGKQFADISVVDTDGNTLSIGKAIIRNLIKALFSIGAVVALFTQKKQALHDMAGGTLVVKNY
jgi:uncharacterized RDD family membrane protein YckC